MLRSMATLLTARGRNRQHADGRAEWGEVRLALPPSLPATMGCDAVGLPARHGFRLMSRLRGTGCVFADTDWWWWIVPAGSDAELRWPLPACYAAGARVPDRSPRLIHRPDHGSPYTPPIPLYLLVCQLTGIAPAWSGPAGHGLRTRR
ncbi:hypothetical protein ACLGI4_03810 [Streptomyces sp. HMX112]|uniref:hypothetical protein n=1 Tax=Streptomyces sp. HMX112 TaxID=3390850 RepID=UPI003A807592